MGSLEPGGGMNDVLMLVVVVFAPLGEADGGKALAVEGAVVAAAQVAVGPGDKECGKRMRRTAAREVSAGGVGDGAGQFAAGRVVLFAQRADAARLLRRCGVGNAFGKYAHPVFELQTCRRAWCCRPRCRCSARLQAASLRSGPAWPGGLSRPVPALRRPRPRRRRLPGNAACSGRGRTRAKRPRRRHRRWRRERRRARRRTLVLRES